MPDVIAAVSGVEIGGVLHKFNGAFPAVGLDFGPGDPQQRADQPAPDRRDAPQPLQSAAPDQVQQDGFGVVVRVVGGGNFCRADPICGLLQKRVSKLPGGLFQSGAPGSRQGGDIRAAGVTGDSPSGAPAPDKFHILSAFRADVVVHGGGLHLESGAPAQLGEQVQQAHGICSAGNSRQHGFAGANHLLRADAALNFVE